MEMLEDKIRAFSAISTGDGAGYGAGYGFGVGGYGDGYGILNYDKNGTDGVVWDVAGPDANIGCGCGCGFGSSYGYGYGSGDDLGVKEINGNIVCIIDDIPTIITSVRNNIA